MKDQDKTSEELVSELLEMREKIADLEASLVALNRQEEARQEVETTFKTMIEAFDGLIYMCSPLYKVEFMNERFIQRTGYNPVGEDCFRALHGRDEICPWCVNEKVQLGETVRWEVQSPKDSRWYRVVNTPVHHRDGTISKMAMIQDITDRKRSENVLRARLRLVEYATSHSLDELLQATLDEVEVLTDSSIGFYHFLDPDQKTLRLQAWSTKTLREMCTAEGKGLHYDIDQAGVWVDCVHQRRPEIHNDYSALPHRKGMPVGHADVTRELVVPVLRGDRIVAILGVGNKPVDYDASDIETVSLFADLAWDIAERKQTEERLRLLDFALDHVREAAFLIDEHASFHLVNEESCRILGYTRSELLGLSVSDVDPDFPRDRWCSHWEDLKTQGSIVFDGRHKTKDGCIFPVEINANYFEYGGQGYNLALVRDITERKQSEQALREARDGLEKRVQERTREIKEVNESLRREIVERKQAEGALRRSEELFRAIFESAQDLIAIKDLARRYVKVNPAVERVLGLPASQIIGLKSEDLVDTRFPKAIKEYESRVLSGETVEGERALTIKGATYVFHYIGVPLRDPDGTIIGICSISRDISERKTAGTFGQVSAQDYQSKPMQAALSEISHAAASDVIVLLQGESGSGKDYAARRIHDLSCRAGGPFFSINCAALPPNLAESELFGHEAGAFTGAVKRKKGLLELAEGGTLLLNEIGELSLSLQSKLLSFLDTRSFLRVGGEKSITVNARLMAASHRDLEVEAGEGRFLRPLYYRLSVFSIHIPPLRERVEDIPFIAKELMANLAREMQFSVIPAIEPADMRALQTYHWPGNIRELRNVLERALIVCGEGPFRLSLPTLEQAPGDWSHTVRFLSGQTLRDVTDEVTHGLCTEALRVCEGSKAAAARMLGISRDSMYRYMKRFGLASEDQAQD